MQIGGIASQKSKSTDLIFYIFLSIDCEVSTLWKQKSPWKKKGKDAIAQACTTDQRESRIAITSSSSTDVCRTAPFTFSSYKYITYQDLGCFYCPDLVILRLWMRNWKPLVRSLLYEAQVHAGEQETPRSGSIS